MSADSNRRRKRRPRTVIVRGHAFTGLLLSAANFKKIFLPLQRTVTVRGRTSRGLLLSADVPAADVPAADYYCPRTYLPRTITVRGRTCHGLLLSADVLAADYNSHVQKGGICPSCRLSTCFLQVLLVLVFTFFKISFEWDTSFKIRLQI